MVWKNIFHTDLMKWPCLAVKACQQQKYLIVLYIEKLLKHKINRMRGLIKLLAVNVCCSCIFKDRVTNHSPRRQSFHVG